MAIEQRQFVGLDYVRITTPDEFEAWCVEAGWASALDFEGETGCGFERLKGIWFYAAEGPQRSYVYERTAAGVRCVF